MLTRQDLVWVDPQYCTKAYYCHFQPLQVAHCRLFSRCPFPEILFAPIEPRQVQVHIHTRDLALAGVLPQEPVLPATHLGQGSDVVIANENIIARRKPFFITESETGQFWV